MIMKLFVDRGTALLVTLLGISACNSSIGSLSDSEGDTEATGADETSGASTPTSGNADGGEFMPCTAANPCPDGQFCFNGLCALGCQSNGDCGDDQYCDTEFDRLCHNKTVSTCPETPCAEGQECVNGFCSAGPTDEVCMQMPNGEDGCAKDSLCIAEPDDQESYKCYPFPACPEDGQCPIGTEGAVCNDGILPSKSRICLIGLCLAADDCPSEWKCVQFDGEPVGLCSSGAFGYPCNGDADCLSGSCNTPFPGQPGFCN